MCLSTMSGELCRMVCHHTMCVHMPCAKCVSACCVFCVHVLCERCVHHVPCAFPTSGVLVCSMCPRAMQNVLMCVPCYVHYTRSSPHLPFTQFHPPPPPGYLNVLTNSRWRERWCRVRDKQLILHKDRTDLKTHLVSIPLRGCEVIPGLDAKHPLTFRLLRNGQEVAVLEVCGAASWGRGGPRANGDGLCGWTP